jgi:hypothetical protein
MLKVAIVGGFKYHLECVGFICELFQNNAEINLYYHEEYFGYVPYFKQLYTNLNVYTTFVKEDIIKNNIIIKLTSNDPILEAENIISILHVYSAQDKSARYITLSPFIQSDSKTNYIFPIYRGLISRTHEKIITYIGHFQPDYFDEDLDQLISGLPDYEFYFISHGVKQQSFGANKNVRCFPACRATELVELVSKSKFILHRHIQFSNFDRFSGALSLAVSHRKPLILSTYFAETYGLPAITYDTMFCEVTDKINRMTDAEYLLELDKLDTFIEVQSDANKKKMATFICADSVEVAQ